MYLSGEEVILVRNWRICKRENAIVGDMTSDRCTIVRHQRLYMPMRFRDATEGKTMEYRCVTQVIRWHSDVPIYQAPVSRADVGLKTHPSHYRGITLI